MGAAPVKLILDVDTGTDDAVALMLAALHPAVDLVAATSVNGNVPVAMTTENTLRVFDHIDDILHRPQVPHLVLRQLDVKQFLDRRHALDVIQRVEPQLGQFRRRANVGDGDHPGPCDDRDDLLLDGFHRSTAF